MRWEDFRQSENIEDRRGGHDPSDGGGGGLSLPGGGGGLGMGAIIILTLIGWAVGINPSILIGGAGMLTGGSSRAPQEQTQQASRPSAPPADQIGRFVSSIVGNNEDIWSEILPAQKNIKFTPAPPWIVVLAGPEVRLKLAPRLLPSSSSVAIPR